MYLRKDGTAYFSMLSPKERGVSSHSTYLGSYLENKDAKVRSRKAERKKEIIRLFQMTLVASPSTLSHRSSENDLFERDSGSSLENTSCCMERIPGFTYYKYRKEDGSSFLTPVSPRNWGPSCPHTFVKAYRETKSGVVGFEGPSSKLETLLSSLKQLVPVRRKSESSLSDSESKSLEVCSLDSLDRGLSSRV